MFLFLCFVCFEGNGLTHFSLSTQISLPAFLSWRRKDFGKKECDAVEAFLDIAGQEVMGYSRILYAGLFGEGEWEGRVERGEGKKK